MLPERFRATISYLYPFILSEYQAYASGRRVAACPPLHWESLLICEYESRFLN
jgi:hypothetical protein